MLGTLPLSASASTSLHHWSCGAIRALCLEIEIRGQPMNSAPLWVANHLSWLDPLALLSLRPMGVLAKSEVADYPLIGDAARRSGLTFVDRNQATSRAAALVRLASDLRKGRPMLLFPEGTTTLGQGLSSLQEGGLRAAYRCGVAVQPLRLSSPDAWYPWIGDDALLPHLRKILRATTTRLRLDVGEVLDPARFAHEDAWCQTIRRQLNPACRGSLEP